MADEKFDKLPPQNIEAEQSVLGSILLDKKSIVKIADILKPDDFYRDTHKIIYQTMLQLFEKGEPIDIMTVSNYLEEKKQLEKVGGSSYLTELINSVPTAANVVKYAKIVQRKKMLRDLIEAAHNITQLSYQEAEDIEELLDDAEKRIFAVSQRSLKQFFIPIKPALEESFERIDQLHKHEGGALRGTPTGFKDLDNILAGLQKADYILLAARPSLGKTTLALDIARNIAVKEKKPVGIFSLEMASSQVVDRILCAQANIDLWKLRTGRLSSKGDDNDFSRIQDAIGILSESPIFIDDSASSTVLEIKTKARRLQAEHNLGLIIIDYIQLIDSPFSKYSNPVQQMTEISRSLKTLARELDVPVLAISQLSRASEQRSPRIPRLADLRESGCLIGDTLITKADTGERIPIKILAKRKKQIPIPVMAIDENLKIKPHTMTKVFSSGEKMVFELKTRSGRKIKASANHPFLKLEDWQRLDQLKIGDYIALPRNLTPQNPSNSLSPEELILLAHLLGDGCILPRQPFHYTSADRKNIQIVKDVAKQLFDIKGRVIKQKNWYHIYLPSPYHLTHKKYHPITNWFRRLGIERVRSWEKEIPNAVFQCNQKKIALFLKHLWATDGNLSWKRIPGRKPAGSIYYSTSSRILAEQVQHLLLRLDIQSSLREVPSRKYRTMYHLYIEGANEQLKFISKIGIVGGKAKIVRSLKSALEKIITNTNIDIIPKEAWTFAVAPAKERLGIGWREVHKSINTAYCGTTIFKSGISRQRMKRLYNALKDPFLEKLSNSDIFWDKIISIKRLGVEEVYDATIEGVHNFVANDFIVHNSLEQDADVVMLIYREDMDIKQSERKNIADIIIAKHRNGPIGQVELYFDSDRVSFRSLEKKYEK